ncbi:MAG: HPr(Ser) kinase/phosphatase [Lachnospiraceae bacterium]|nr:HPr(Ser) kinase/phosphatase [Lachnospiraceae bacterium]
MNGVSLQKIAERLGLTNLTPEVSLEEINIELAEMNRPALQLTGFFDHFDSARIQVMGNVEHAYLSTMSQDRQLQVIEELFKYGIPCLVVTRGHIPTEEFLALAWRYHVPILSTKATTSEFQARLMRYLQVTLAPMVTIHGVLVDVFGEGVLIIGESGMGKSEVALELIKRGHRLVADDSVQLRRYSDTELLGSAPEVTKYLMELRGVGVIDVKALFGAECVKDEMPVSMVIRLEDYARDRKYEFDRLGTREEFVEYLDVRVPCTTVPVSPGRNVAIIVETASINFRCKRMGYDAYQELEKRFNEKMRRGLGDL